MYLPCAFNSLMLALIPDHKPSAVHVRHSDGALKCAKIICFYFKNSKIQFLLMKPFFFSLLPPDMFRSVHTEEIQTKGNVYFLFYVPDYLFS